MRLGFSNSVVRKSARPVYAQDYLEELYDLAWVPVESSNLASIAYDEDEQMLYVRFLPKENPNTGYYYPGTTYEYYDVEPEIYEAFLQAGSKGEFLWEYIRDRYVYSRLDDWI